MQSSHGQQTYAGRASTLLLLSEAEGSSTLTTSGPNCAPAPSLGLGWRRGFCPRSHSWLDLRCYTLDAGSEKSHQKTEEKTDQCSCEGRCCGHQPCLQLVSRAESCCRPGGDKDQGGHCPSPAENGDRGSLPDQEADWEKVLPRGICKRSVHEAQRDGPARGELLGERVYACAASRAATHDLPCSSSSSSSTGRGGRPQKACTGSTGCSTCQKRLGLPRNFQDVAAGRSPARGNFEVPPRADWRRREHGGPYCKAAPRTQEAANSCAGEAQKGGAPLWPLGGSG